MSDESLFREVDEEVRQDRAKAVWQRYGNLITAVAVGVVLAVAALKGWQYWQARQAEASALVYFDAAKKAADGKTEDAAQAFAAVTHSGYAQLAELRRAALLAEQGKRDEAVKRYDSLAAASGTDPTVRDLARLRAGYLLADTLKPDELLNRLGAFDTETNPWRNAAREIFGLAAWRTGDYAMADRYMTAIAGDPAAPSDLRERAQAMLQLLTPLLAR